MEEYTVDQMLSEEDKKVYFSFLFDANTKEFNYRRNRRKTIVLLVASLGMIAFVIFRVVTSDVKLVNLILPIILLGLLAAQFLFKRKDKSMYQKFTERFKGKDVHMSYSITPQLIEVLVGNSKEDFSYENISRCKSSKEGMFIELELANKKRVSILTRPSWPYYKEIIILMKDKGIQIRNYEMSIE